MIPSTVVSGAVAQRLTRRSATPADVGSNPIRPHLEPDTRVVAQRLTRQVANLEDVGSNPIDSHETRANAARSRFPGAVAQRLTRQPYTLEDVGSNPIS